MHASWIPGCIPIGQITQQEVSNMILMWLYMVSNTRVTDTGLYTCRADNAVGSVEHDFDVAVYGK